MKRLLILVILALAACVAYVALSGGGADAQQPPLIDHYKCYQARHAKGSPRFVPDKVFLTDQFEHNKETTVLKLNTFCSNGNQISREGSSAGHSGADLTCYTIRDAPGQPRFSPQNIRVRNKLSEENQALTVSKAQSLCVPASKGIFQGPFEGAGFKCYQARTAKGQPRFQQQNVTIFDQFGVKDARVIRPVAYCSEVEKKVDATNDDFDNQHSLPDSNVCHEAANILECQDHVSTVHTGLEDNDPIISCKTDYSNSVWYHWSSAADDSIILDTEGTTYDTVVTVFTGEKNNLQEVGCNQNPSPFDPLQFDATANVVYRILVASSDGHGGKLKFHLRTKERGTNDNFVNATTVPNLQDYPYLFFDHVSTMSATTEGNDPADLSCTSGTPEYSNSVWYTYTPTKHEQVLFYTFDSSYDTVLAVYSGTKSSLVELACSDNYFDLTSSTVEVTLKGNATYHILVGSKGSSDGGKLKFTAVLFDSLSSGQSAGVGAERVAGDSLTCYQVRQARHRTETEHINDQFSNRQLNDEWILTIGGVDSLCVPSTKDPCSGASAYTNGFQGNVGSEWSDTSTDTTPVGNRRFLGQFDNETVSLNLDGLPEHDNVTVCFDLFAIDSWDGNDVSYGPDVWDLSVNGGPTLLHTTFSNEVVAPRPQNYPDSYPGSKSPPKTGAAEVDTLGYSSDFGDSVYHLVFTFAHTTDSIQFDFSALGLQGIGDESWGLDNVVVKVH